MEMRVDRERCTGCGDCLEACPNDAIRLYQGVAVIDPETNIDVVRMRLVDNLWIDLTGKVRYTFRPSSFVCPIAVSLAMQIKQAIAEVPGVRVQEIAVEGYLAAEELQKLINQEI